MKPTKALGTLVLALLSLEIAFLPGVGPAQAYTGVAGTSYFDVTIAANSASVALATGTGSATNVLLVVAVATSDSATTVNSVTDNNSLTWTKAGGVAATADDLEIWYASSAGPISSDSINVTLSGGLTGWAVMAFAVVGAAAPRPSTVLQQRALPR